MDDMTPQLFEKVGGMDARITNLEERTKNMDGKLDTLLIRTAEQKGGKGALITVGSGGLSVGALIVAAAQWLGVGVPPTQAPPAQDSRVLSAPAPSGNGASEQGIPGGQR